MLLFISCSDSLFDKTQPLDVNANLDKDLTYQIIAKSIAKSLDNKEVQTILSEKALLQEDGDFDVLFSKLIKNSTESTSEKQLVSTFDFLKILKQNTEENLVSLRKRVSKDTDSTSISFDNFIQQIKEDYPLLQISIPNAVETDTDGRQSNNILNDSTLVAFIPSSFDDQIETDITAYDKYGNEYKLSSTNAPQLPVIVISDNERIIAISKKDTNRNIPINTTFFFENEYYLYYVTKTITTNEKNSVLHKIKTEATLSSVRDDNNMFDYITHARFTSQNNLRRYESWALGKPEVVLTILYFNNLLSPRQIKYNDSGWYDGNNKYLNTSVINWVPTSINYYITYYWDEEDSGSDKSKTKTISVTDKNTGITVSTTYTIPARANNDHIGYYSVSYYDPVPHIYDPTGQNFFNFTIDLKN
ncbi:MAG: hypothetical protein ACK5L7_05105 [Paludibacteraceae bacterium]